MSNNKKKRNRGQQNGVKIVMGIIGVCMAGYMMGPPLYWHLSDLFESSLQCPPCLCDCSTEPLLAFFDEEIAGLNNFSITDCIKHDPDVSDEMVRITTGRLREELRVKEAEALEMQRNEDRALLEAKKMASQYQKEADKCNAGMETCEEAREKAEEALEAQRDLSSVWQLRARQLGWRPNVIKTSPADD